MTFATPRLLALLAVLIPAAALAMYGDRERARALSRFGRVSLLRRVSAIPSAHARAVAHGLTLGALLLAVLALARPQVGRTPHALRGGGGDVLFVLDLSRSMMARDVVPSRLVAAKQAVATIARSLPTDRVGLVVFGGSAFLQLPLTLDHSTFATFLDAASPEDIPDPSTNLEAAADMIVQTWTLTGSGPYGAAVLVSDGEDVEGKLENAAEALVHAGIRTSTVGVGTLGGTTLLDHDSAGREVAHRDWAGRAVTTRLVERNLEDVARRTGGVYVRWAGEESVRPVVTALARLPRRPVSAEQATAPPAERFQWPLALAFLLLLAEGAWQWNTARLT